MLLVVGRSAKCGRQIGCDPLTVIRFTRRRTGQRRAVHRALAGPFTLRDADAAGRCCMPPLLLLNLTADVLSLLAVQTAPTTPTVSLNYAPGLTTVNLLRIG